MFVIIETRIPLNVFPSCNDAKKVCYEFRFFFSSLDVTSCVIKGDRNPHPINSYFITSDCTLHCYCSKGGLVSCMELCPQASPLQCPPGSELHEDEVSVGSGGDGCSCKTKYCVPPKGTFLSRKTHFFPPLWFPRMRRKENNIQHFSICYKLQV